MKRNRLVLTAQGLLTLTGAVPVVSVPWALPPIPGALTLVGSTPPVIIAPPITYDAAGNGGTTSTGTTNASWSHTATGSNLAVLVGISVRSTGFSVSSATYAGVAMTLLGTALWNNNSHSGATLIYGMLAPPVGTRTVAITTSGNSLNIAAQSHSFTGVSMFGSVVTNFGSSTTMSVSVTAQQTGATFAMMGCQNGSNPTGFTQTVRMAAGNGTTNGWVAGSATGTGSATSYSAGTGGSVDWGVVGVPLVA